MINSHLKECTVMLISNDAEEEEIQLTAGLSSEP